MESSYEVVFWPFGSLINSYVSNCDVVDVTYLFFSKRLLRNVLLEAFREMLHHAMRGKTLEWLNA